MFSKYESEQANVCKLLNNSINTDRYSHAYLFVINKYENAYDMIYDFIKYLCCPKSIKDCAGCNICRLIDENSFSDFKLIDSDSLILKKDAILELEDYFDTKRIDGKKRVYMIKSCERMNVASGNTLLKFLEEPEDDIIAILTTNNINQVMDTIKSRCQIIYFNVPDAYLDNNLYYQLCGCCSIKSSDDFIEDVKHVIEFSKTTEKYGVDSICYTKHQWHCYFTERTEFMYALNIMLYLYFDVVNYKIGQPIRYFNSFIDSIKEISNYHDTNYYSNKIRIIVKYIDLIKYNLNLNLLLDKILLECEV